MRRSALIALAPALAIGALSAGPVLGASPTALWHMNETSGTVMNDSSGHGYNGTLSNVKTGVAGFNGSTAYGFNGSSSKVIVRDAPGLNPGTKDLVVSVHVAFTAVPADDYDLIRKGLQSTSGGDWKIEIVNVSGAAIARCYLRGSSGSWQKTTGPNLADGAWHTITCERHATSVQMSVDGTVWKKTKTIGSISNTASLSIGAKADGGDWTKGTIDEVSVTIG
jgi:Concanavalin A-like lectin/glucanases superfamily